MTDSDLRREAVREALSQDVLSEMRDEQGNPLLRLMTLDEQVDAVLSVLPECRHPELSAVLAEVRDAAASAARRGLLVDDGWGRGVKYAVDAIERRLAAEARP